MSVRVVKNFIGIASRRDPTRTISFRRAFIMDVENRIRLLAGFGRHKSGMKWRAWTLPFEERLQRRQISLFEHEE